MAQEIKCKYAGNDTKKTNNFCICNSPEDYKCPISGMPIVNETTGEKVCNKNLFEIEINEVLEYKIDFIDGQHRQLESFENKYKRLKEIFPYLEKVIEGEA